MKNSKMTTVVLMAWLISLGIVSCSTLNQKISSSENRADIYETVSLDTSLDPASTDIIYFKANSANISDDEILRSGLPLLISSKNISKISIVGHDDTAGSTAKSMVLSQRRANALSNYFISNGLDKSKISTEGKGEMDLFLETGDEVIEKLNRRVEYTIQTKTKFGDCEDQAIQEKGLFSRRAKRTFNCVKIFYGTNRQRDRDIDVNTYTENPYGDVALPIDTSVKYGELIVTVPAKHVPGAKISSLKDGRIPTLNDRGKKFTIWNWSEEDELTQDEFVKRARQVLRNSDTYKDQAFVFIHGYNVDFRSAAFRTAQIKSDIEFDGPAFFFSWPSNSETDEYFSDQDDADASIDYFVEYLQTIRKSIGPNSKLHVISHSMGNRVFAQAIYKMASMPEIEQVNFDTAIIAHADVDDRLFQQWVLQSSNTYARPIFKQAILYVTDDDKPLGLSNRIRSPFTRSTDIRYRVGLSSKKMGPRNVFPSPYSTFDLSHMNRSILTNFFALNHSKYVENLPSICHIGQLFRGANLVPQILNGGVFEPHETEKGLKYWRLKENGHVRTCEWDE